MCDARGDPRRGPERPPGARGPRKSARLRLESDAPMISVQNVSKAFGPKKLFEEVDVTFAPGNRYGLTGPNGAGKTTFMKILAGDEEADTGQIHRPKRLGILRQDHYRFEDSRVV